MEPGETVIAAATRELFEELDLKVIEIGRCLYRVHDIGSPFVIEFTETSVQGVLRAIEHEAIGWFSRNQLANLDLAPADQAFVRYVLNSNG